MSVEIFEGGGLELPPLLSDVAVTPDADPLAAAEEAARAGVDAGVVFWSLRDDRIEAAIVLAPEAPLRRALTVLFGVEQAVTDAIGALGPAEISALWAWPDALLLNQARVGRIRVAASTHDPDAVPDWLIFALSLRRAPEDDADPGDRPDDTSLAAEGLGDIGARELIGAWARHALYWITSWEGEGLAPIMREWAGRAVGADAEVRIALGPEAPIEGQWLGLDDEGDLTIKTASGATRLDLTRVLSPEFVAAGSDPLARPAALTRIDGSGPMGGEALRKR